MDFETLRDKLLAEHKRFDIESLRELSFADLIRAGIGDAGDASCSLDLIRDERNRRVLDAAAELTQQRGPIIIKDPDLHDAAVRLVHKRPTPTPHWDTLSPQTRAYLLLRCLRSHLDSPEARFEMLAATLKEIEATCHESCQLCSFAMLMRTVIGNVRESLNEDPVLDLVQFRKRTFDFFKFVRDQIPVDEQTVRSHLEVSGYHCTYGCFLPGAP